MQYSSNGLSLFGLIANGAQSDSGNGHESLKRGLLYLNCGLFILVFFLVGFDGYAVELLRGEAPSPSINKVIFNALAVAALLSLLVATAKFPQKVNLLFNALTVVAVTSALFFTQLNGLSASIVSSFGVLPLVLLAVGSRWALLGGFIFTALLFTIVRFSSPGVSDPAIESRIFFTLLLLVPALSLFLYSRHLVGQTSLQVVKVCLLVSVVGSVVFWLVAPTWKVNALYTAAATLGMWVWLRRAQTLNTWHRLVLVGIPSLAFCANLTFANGLTLYVLPGYILMAFLVLNRLWAIGLTAFYLSLGVLSQNATDPFVVRMVLGTLIFSGALSLIFSNREAAQEPPARPRISWIASGVFAGSLITLVALLPLLLGMVDLRSESVVTRFGITMAGIFFIASWLFYEVFRYLASINDRREQSFNDAKVTSKKLKQALHSVEKSNESLEEKQALQARMFAVIGHELRTPAAALHMLLEQSDSDKWSRNRQQLIDISQHLISVLDDLRFVAQPREAVRNSVSVARPEELLRGVAQGLELLINQHGKHLHIELDELQGVECCFNVQALRQITLNLLKNAAVHSNGTDIWLRAVVKTDAEQLQAQISVEDNGEGVPTDHVPQLFDEFFRGDLERDGTGLGLSICRTLAEALNGGIEYHEREGGGAKFVLDVGLERVNDTPTQTAQSPDEKSLKGTKILLAEDNPTIQLLTKVILSKAGVEVFVANDGCEAQEIFNESGPFDAVLTDIFMPRMNGYELTRWLKQRGYSKPIIGVSAATVGEETELLLEAGATQVLSKPIKIDLLKEVIL